ncbi:MAG: trigger factor family protein [Prevotellaceae bacterium]|jgi:trigger factor|nr:trigger factor family protein [Prevotellaceae bacterium]
MELIQNREDLVATLTVKISQEDYAAKVEKELKKARQTAQLKGFRQGNVPMPLIRKMYESPILLEEVNKLVIESLGNYEKEHEGYLVGQIIPSEGKQSMIDFKTQKDFEFVYEAAFFPEFTYHIDQDTEATYYNILVDEKDVDNDVNNYRNQKMTLADMEEVEDNSLIKVKIDVAGKDGVQTRDTSFALNEDVVDEYKSLFLGAKAGNVIDVEIRRVFTDETVLKEILDIGGGNEDESDDEGEEEGNKEETGNEDVDLLALQPETLPFTIVGISKRVPAELNQEFFDAVVGTDKVHSEEELREYIRGKIRAEYAKFSLDKLADDSPDILKAKANITLPEEFIEKYLRYIQDDEQMSDDKFSNLLTYFIEDLKWTHIVNSLLRQADIKITSDEVIEEAKAMLRKHLGIYSYNFDMDSLVTDYLKDEKAVHQIVLNLKVGKVAELLKANAKLNIVDISFAEFCKLYETKSETENLPENNQEVEEIEAVEVIEENKETGNLPENSPEIEEIEKNETVTVTENQ